MVDRLSSERRSRVMSRIRNKNTLPEIRVRKAAHALGLRFRLYSKQLPGHPDLVFPKRHIALFVHGCFWHRHVNCKYASTPSSNVDFWSSKFAANVQRDKIVTDELNSLGWRVEVIWECETVNPTVLRDSIQTRILK